jgi:hypothetical protein
MKIYKTQFLLEFIDLDYESPPRHFVLVEIINGIPVRAHIGVLSGSYLECTYYPYILN